MAVAAVEVEIGITGPVGNIALGRVRIDHFYVSLGLFLHLAQERQLLASPQSASSDYYPDMRVMERASIIGTQPLRHGL